MGARNYGPVRKVRRDGRVIWVIDFFWFDKSGRKQRYRRDAHVQTRESALLEARSLQERAHRDGSLALKPATPTFRSFVEGSFRELRLPHFRQSTRTRYEALLGQGLLDHFGSMRLDAISNDAMHAFAAKLAARKVQLKGALTLLGTILRSAFELGLLDTMQRIPRLWKESRKLPSAPSLDDVARLVASARGWLRTAIALAAYAGLRSGEVRALEVQDVQLADGHLLVRRALSEAEVTTPKSGHERFVPIGALLKPVLEEAISTRAPKARIVVTSKGTTPSRQAILGRLKKLEAKIGMHGWTFHQFRHAFCTGLLRSGANVEIVRGLAGHASLAHTQRYVHAMGADATAAMERFQPR